MEVIGLALALLPCCQDNTPYARANKWCNSEELHSERPNLFCAN
jgi:hypothetical protein